MKTGILALGRPTFDVEFAEQKLAAMLAVLEKSTDEFVGSRQLLMDPDSAREEIAHLNSAQIDRLLILQVTFTDAALTVEAAQTLDCPLSIWAVPEPRNGGRLRLNAFCGLNLASHALGLNNKPFSWIYREPSDVSPDDLGVLLDGSGAELPPKPQASTTPDDTGQAIADAISGSRIARIGEHPEGFHTCAYDSAELSRLSGVSVDEIDLKDLFSKAGSVSTDEAAALRQELEGELSGLDAVNKGQLDRSLKLKLALDQMRGEGNYDAFAIRCWPETFTEYGGAVCGPASMMGESRVPCACEADVYGALTQLILQQAAQAPVFLTDIVDVDTADDSAVVWHCGQAPKSMAQSDVAPEATIHTNRKMPLLYQFALKPGPVTLMRISQAFGEPKMILSTGEMLDRPMSYTGTSGVVRPAAGAARFLERMIGSRMEHHMALAYGDHASVLRSTAAALGLPVLEL